MNITNHFVLRLLERVCPDHLYEEIEGDLIQKFNRDVALYGLAKARRKFTWNTLRFFRPAIIARHKKSITPNSTAMLLNFIKTGIRFNLKERFYASLNLLGLMVGLVSVMILAAFAYNELSYDTFHTEYKKIYRLTTHFNYGDRETGFAVNRGMFDVALDDAKDIESSTAFMKIQSSLIFGVDDKLFSDSRGFYSDEDFFSVFDFHFLAGDRTRCLEQPNSIVLTEAMARKLFNSIDVLGRTLLIKDDDSATEFSVTGVIENIPVNSHLTFNFIISGTSQPYWKGLFNGNKGPMACYIYFKTTQESSTLAVQENLNRLFSPYQQEGSLYLAQPLDEIYFNAKNEFEFTAEGNLQYVKIFIWVGIALLVITIVNFINISSSHSLKRIKEIGVRKSLGTTRASLVTQFLVESVLVTLVTTILSYGIAVVFLRWLSPSFYPIELSVTMKPATWLAIAGFGILLGLLAGLYPALKITTLRTTSALKGRVTLSKEAIYSPRNILVLVQLIFTISLISFLLLMHRQVDFLSSRLHTADGEKVLYLNRPQTASDSQWQGLQVSISAQSPVVLTCASSHYPIIENELGKMGPAQIYMGDDFVQAAWNPVSNDFIETMGMTLVEGHSFSRASVSDSTVIINEAARQALGLKDAVGTTVQLYGGIFKIIGVVEDFHYQSFHNKITPVIFTLVPSSRILYARTDNPRLALESIEKVWKSLKIDAPFDPHFLDDSFEKMLEKENRLSGVIVAFTIIALLVLAIGTLGLIGYVVAQKQKEIGVRKVFGASLINLLLHLNYRFFSLLAIAIVCSSLLVFKFSYVWLATFEYKVSFSITDFVLGAAIVAFLSFIIIEAQAIRAALVNPVKTLRDE